MPFQPGHNLSSGRPKGALNKDTQTIKEAITAMIIGGLPDFLAVMGELRETNPVKFTENYMKLMEYSIPKLRSVDSTVTVDPESLGAIKIEVVTREKTNEGIKDTSNGSLPEELPGQ